MTPATDLYHRLLRPLEQAGAVYMITGGLAAIIYGEPRLTNDVDIVLRLDPADAERFARGFPGEGWYLPPVETIREEAGRPQDGHFNILEVETSLRADIYCLGSDPLGAWAMSRRRPITLGGENVWVAPIEYVILQKLRWFRESGSDRHLRDIAAMRRISGHMVDEDAVQSWVERLDLNDVWRRATRGT